MRRKSNHFYIIKWNIEHSNWWLEKFRRFTNLLPYFRYFCFCYLAAVGRTLFFCNSLCIEYTFFSWVCVYIWNYSYCRCATNTLCTVHCNELLLLLLFFFYCCSAMFAFRTIDLLLINWTWRTHRIGLAIEANADFYTYICMYMRTLLVDIITTISVFFFSSLLSILLLLMNSVRCLYVL